jgi:DNA modification methylase
VINADSIEAMKSMESECIDLLVTDPPYKTISGGCKDGKRTKRPKGILKRNSGTLFTHQNVNIYDWMPEVYRILKYGSHAYIFTNVLNLTEMLNESQKAGFKLHNLLCWEKNNCVCSQFYMKNCEYILFLRKGKAKWINDIGGSKTVHQFDNIIGNKTHPCEKPVDLLKFYISNSSREGDIVFDPFCGTGSTLVAAKELDRSFLGYEIDKEYFDIVIDRLNCRKGGV